MSCRTNRCAIRMLQGHGTTSYKPTNPEAVRQFQSSYDAMMAERARQDSGVFQQPTVSKPTSDESKADKIICNNEPVLCKEYYSLSDSSLSSSQK